MDEPRFNWIPGVINRCRHAWEWTIALIGLGALVLFHESPAFLIVVGAANVVASAALLRMVRGSRRKATAITAELEVHRAETRRDLEAWRNRTCAIEHARDAAQRDAAEARLGFERLHKCQLDEQRAERKTREEETKQFFSQLSVLEQQLNASKASAETRESVLREELENARRQIQQLHEAHEAAREEWTSREQEQASVIASGAAAIDRERSVVKAANTALASMTKERDQALEQLELAQSRERETAANLQLVGDELAELKSAVRDQKQIAGDADSRLVIMADHVRVLSEQQAELNDACLGTSSDVTKLMTLIGSLLEGLPSHDDLRRDVRHSFEDRLNAVQSQLEEMIKEAMASVSSRPCVEPSLEESGKSSSPPSETEDDALAEKTDHVPPSGHSERFAQRIEQQSVETVADTLRPHAGQPLEDVRADEAPPIDSTPEESHALEHRLEADAHESITPPSESIPDGAQSSLDECGTVAADPASHAIPLESDIISKVTPIVQEHVIPEVDIETSIESAETTQAASDDTTAPEDREDEDDGELQKHLGAFREDLEKNASESMALDFLSEATGLLTSQTPTDLGKKEPAFEIGHLIDEVVAIHNEGPGVAEAIVDWVDVDSSAEFVGPAGRIRVAFYFAIFAVLDDTDVNSVRVRVAHAAPAFGSVTPSIRLTVDGHGHVQQDPADGIAIRIARALLKSFGEVSTRRTPLGVRVEMVLRLEWADENSRDRRMSARLRTEELRCSAGEILDLSLGGMSVRTNQLLEGVQSICLTTESDSSEELEGEVIWTRRLGLREYVCGLRFLSLKEHQSRFIAQTAMQHRNRRVLEADRPAEA